MLDDITIKMDKTVDGELTMILIPPYSSDIDPTILAGQETTALWTPAEPGSTCGTLHIKVPVAKQEATGTPAVH